MNFTTTKKKVVAEEKYPYAVMTQTGSNFSLNKAAMEMFSFPMNTANASKIANGFDDENKLILANIDTGDSYTNNITARNTFSSTKLMERISSQFDLPLISTGEIEWFLKMSSSDDEPVYAYIEEIYELLEDSNKYPELPNDLFIDKVDLLSATEEPEMIEVTKTEVVSTIDSLAEKESSFNKW